MIDDFTQSWDRGEHPRAEGYLDLLRVEDSTELIYHEFCLAELSDLSPDPAEYLRRFPQHAESLGRLFALHGAISIATLRDWANPTDLPEVGDQIGPYQLLRELGRGAFARVFLVEQANLDDRLVVLKVSTRSTAEPRLLARARHPHIVEILRHDLANDGALHLVCLPFLGGATLSAVLQERARLARPCRSGIELLADLDRVSAPEFRNTTMTSPARAMIAGPSYPKALAWIVARLAEALDHAHGRGVAHGDLKPSNVLLTAEGVPMLFDFNLSVDWQNAEPGESSGDLGGTLAYMAPERLKAIVGSPIRPPQQAAASLHRADLYSLGLLLLESLTGHPPEVPRIRSNKIQDLAEALAKLRQTLPASIRGTDRPIPQALRSILTHCLAPDPADRYARGRDLAEDLDRWRTDRPLLFANESQGSDLTRKVRRRRAPLIVLTLTLASALIVTFFATKILTGSKQKVALVKYSMFLGQPDPGVFGSRRIGQSLDEEGRDPVATTSRLMSYYEVASDPNWQDRDDIQTLPTRERGELEVWLFEQILRQSIALQERPDAPNDWRRALDLLDRTLARNASATLEAERSTLRARLDLRGLKALDDPKRPRLVRWMEEYLAGVAVESLHARSALGHYQKALQERPDLFWAQYRAAAVASRIGEHEVAVQQLRDCLRRSPENPALHLYLASSLFHLERETYESYKGESFFEALAECDQAILLDPDYALAYSFRASIRKASGWIEGVKADVARYDSLNRRNGSGPRLTLLLNQQFQPGPNYGRPKDDIESLARKILTDNPRDHATRTTLAATIALEGRPAEAIEELDRVLDADPDHLLARYHRAVQLQRINRAEAIAEYASLIDHPRFEELFALQPSAIRAFHYVATDLMNRGKLTEALEVARRSLSHANRSRSLRNETIWARRKAQTQFDLSPRGETYYLLARIHAATVTADADADADATGRIDPEQIALVTENLSRSFASHERFRTNWYPNDQRFDELRDLINQQMQPILVDR